MLEEFLQRCIDEGLTLKPKKTFIAADRIEYLGFNVDKTGITPLSAKIEPILKYPPPKTRKELRRFIGLTNFYSTFIPKDIK